MQDVPLTINFNGKQLKGFAVPLCNTFQEKPSAFDIIIDKAFLGTLRHDPQGWRIDSQSDSKLAEAIGKYILAWYD